MIRLRSAATTAAGLALLVVPLGAAFAQAPAPFPQGRTVQAEARKIAALVAGAPADVKPAAQELLKAVNEQSAQIAAAITALSMRFQKASAAAQTEAQRLLSPPALAAKLATPGDANGDALGAYVESSVNTSIQHAQQALAAAKEEATKITTNVEGALANAKSQAEALAQRGQPLVEQVTAFIAAAKRQAARVLAASRAQAQAVIAQIAKLGKGALQATAGPPKAFVARVRATTQRTQDAIAAAAARLPAGPGKDAATQLQEKAAETGRTFAQAMRAARQQYRDAIAAAISDAVRASDPAPLQANVKEKGPQATPELEQKVQEVITAATTATRQAVATARDAIKQAVDAAVAVLTPLEAELAKAGPMGASLVQQARMLVTSYRQEGARTVLRAVAQARDAVKRAGRAIREAVAKALGKEAPPSTGRKAALAQLGTLVERVPAAQREAATQAMALVQKASREARDESRKAQREARLWMASAERDAQAAVAALKPMVGDPKQAATTLRPRIQGIVRDLSQRYRAPLQRTRTLARTLVAQAETAFQRVSQLTPRLGTLAGPIVQQARRVTNSTRREAALLLRTVRALSKTAARRAMRATYAAVKATLGVEATPSASRQQLEAFQASLKGLPANLRAAALKVEALMAEERSRSKARFAADAAAIRAARRTARQNARKALAQLMAQMRGAAKQQPALVAEGAKKLIGAARATILAAVNQAKAAAKTYGAALKARIAEAARILAPLGTPGQPIAQAAKQFFEELRMRTARNLLLVQERGKEAVQRVVSKARERLAKGSPGAIRKRSEVRKRTRALAKLVRNAPSAVRALVKPSLERAKLLSRGMRDALKIAVRATRQALRTAETAIGATPAKAPGKGGATKKAKGQSGAKKAATPQRVASKEPAARPAKPPTKAQLRAALKALTEATRKAIAGARTTAGKLVEQGEALTKEIEALAEKGEQAALKPIVAALQGVVRALKRDAARLLLTAKKRASGAVDRLLALARPADKTAPGTKGAPGAKPGSKPAKAAPAKKAAVPTTRGVVVAEVLR